MTLEFYKYQGTGNDFVMLDNRDNNFPKENTALVARLCDRKFGIGADGLILLENDKVSDLTMVYYNADGNPSSMCGNGGRCLVSFAKHLGIIKEKTSFNAVDGLHHASIKDDLVRLQMQDVHEVREKAKYAFLNTGSPHHVQLVNDLKNFEVVKEGAKLRYGLYGEKGSNINYVETIAPNIFAVRTYERGVEDETLSCGTGVTAVALAMHKAGKTEANTIKIQTPGGELQVEFEVGPNGYTNIFLIGPARLVFKGSVDVKA